MPDPIYVVAGAVRIQQWITRTPLLRLSRGASRALAIRTSSGHVDNLVKSPDCAAIRAEDAADVDGVIALQVNSGLHSDVDATIRWLRRTVAEQLPGVEWRLWAHQAPNYAAAFRVGVGDGPISYGRWRLPPADLNLMLASSCGGCKHETAVKTAMLPGGEATKLGLDCLIRLEHTEKSDTERRAGGIKTATETDRAWTFEKLASSGGAGHTSRGPSTLGRREADNHLCTISADGNRFGALFAKLATIPAVRYPIDNSETTIHQAISAALHTAATSAVDTASRVGNSDAPIRCSIDHVIGGDDLLISVGARFAWSYVGTLIVAFETTVKDDVTAAIHAALEGGGIDQSTADDLRGLVKAMSLGIGMCFSHVKHPFAHSAEIAGAALETAKRAGAGEAAVSWLDLTVDSAVPRHRSLRPGELKIEPKVFGYSSSARVVLAGLIRDGWRSLPKSPQQADYDRVAAEIGGSVRAWCARTEKDDLFIGDKIDERAVRQVENDLDRARWWPSTNPES